VVEHRTTNPKIGGSNPGEKMAGKIEIVLCAALYSETMMSDVRQMTLLQSKITRKRLPCTFMCDKKRMEER
jgi:hypothetical protein